MQEVVAEGMRGARRVVGDGDLAGAAVHRGHLGAQPHLDAVAIGHPLKDLRPGGHLEQGLIGHDEDDTDVVEHPPPAPVVGGQVGDLLRGAAALQRGRRVGEDRRARTHPPDQLPGAWRVLGCVVAAHPVVSDGLGQARHAVPVELEAGCHDQVLVGEYGAAGQGHRTGRGVDGQGAATDPAHAVGYEGALRATAGAQRGLAAADEGPQRLVPVRVGRLDQGDAGDAGAAQAGDDTDPGTAATDDDDAVTPGRRLRAAASGHRRRRVLGRGWGSGGQVGAPSRLSV